MMTVKEKEFFLVELCDFEATNDMTVRELRDVIIRGLNDGIRYVSVVSPQGVNRALEEGHTTDEIEINEYIRVDDEDGKMDIEATANAVVKDMIVTSMIIVMRDKYEMINDDGKNGEWIGKILEDD